MTRVNEYAHYERYGIAEAKRAGSWPPTWKGVCRCGWESGWHLTEQAADDDAAEHMRLVADEA